MKHRLLCVQSHSRVILDQCTAYDSRQMASSMRVAVKMVLCDCGRTQSVVHMAFGNAFSLTMCPAQLPSTMAETMWSSRLKYRQLFPACKKTSSENAEYHSSMLELFHFFVYSYYNFVKKNVCYTMHVVVMFVL